MSYSWTWVHFEAAVASYVLCSGEVLHLEVGSIPLPSRIPPDSSEVDLDACEVWCYTLHK